MNNRIPYKYCPYTLITEARALQVMLSLVVDIKNNKKRSGRDSGPPAVLPPPVLAWLKTSGIVDVCLRNLTWPKLLRTNKKVWHIPLRSMFD